MSVLLLSAVTWGYTLSVPVRVNIPLLATSGLKALNLSELLEAFRERGRRVSSSVCLTLTAMALWSLTENRGTAATCHKVSIFVEV